MCWYTYKINQTGGEEAGMREGDVNLLEEYLFQENKLYHCFSMECKSHV